MGRDLDQGRARVPADRLFRVGRCVGTRGPGLVFLIPFIDRPVWVDQRELYLEIPHQTAITKDNATITIDFIIFYRVVDPVDSVLVPAGLSWGGRGGETGETRLA